MMGYTWCMTTSKTIYDFSKQDVCMCMCVAKRKLCVFCFFVQNNNKKSIDFFVVFLRSGKASLNKSKLCVCYHFYVVSLRKKIFLVFPKKQVILACKFKHYKVLLNRNKVCVCATIVFIQLKVLKQCSF
jgi:hypothetical protein